MNQETQYRVIFSYFTPFPTGSEIIEKLEGVPGTTNAGMRAPRAGLPQEEVTRSPP